MFDRIITGLLAFFLFILPGWLGLIDLDYLHLQRTNNTNIAAPKIIRAIEAQDIAALEALMSQTLRDDFEDLSDRIGEMMDAIEGEIISSRWEQRGGSSNISRGDGRRIIQAGVCLYFTTSAGSYDVMIWWETANNFAPEELGIRNIGLGDPNGNVLVIISSPRGMRPHFDN